MMDLPPEPRKEGTVLHSMFIGRWQPLHDGHKKLIQSVIDEGKNVCIAIRDTPISPENPYTVEERRAMIQEAFPNAPIVVIPDIEEVIYGRSVGWSVREIRLDKETEDISATKIRAAKGEASGQSS